MHKYTRTGPFEGQRTFAGAPLFSSSPCVLQSPNAGSSSSSPTSRPFSTKPSHRAAARGRSSKSTSSQHFSNGHRRRCTFSFAHVSGFAAFGSPLSCFRSLDLTLPPCPLVLGPHVSRTSRAPHFSPLPGLRSSHLGLVLIPFRTR